MISQKITRGILSLFVMVSLASASLYAIRPEATQSSEVLTELRSELRSELREESTVYDYQGITNPEVKNLIRRRELEIKDVMIRNFSRYAQEVLELKLAQADKIEEILQTVAGRHLPKADEKPSRFADTDYASRDAVRQIKQVVAPSEYDVWKLQKLEEALGTEIEQFIHEILSYKLLFAGFDFDGKKRGESVVNMFKASIMDALFDPLKSGRLTVSYLQEFQEVEDERFYDADYFKEQTGWNALIRQRHKRKQFSGIQTEKMNVEVTKVLEEIIEKIRPFKKPTQIYDYASKDEIAAIINRIMVNRSGSVHPLEKTNEEAKRITDAIRSTVLGKLALNRSRILNTGIVFYFDDLDRPGYALRDLAGGLHNVPPIPVWVLRNGLITVNIRYLDKVRSILEGALKLPDDFEEKAAEGVFQIYAPRSEVRKISPQSTVHRPQAIAPPVDFFFRRSIQVPGIPDVENGKVLSGRSAFGIQAQDAFVIDLKLIRTQYDLAVLFAVFNHFPFVLLGDDADTPIAKTIQAMNAKLPPSERVLLASSAEESLQLLQQRRADQMRRSNAYPKTFTQTRLILSDQTSLDAAALQKQLGDHVVVQTTTLDQFSQTAFGVANRLELADFAAELHQKVLSQLLTAESA